MKAETLARIYESYPATEITVEDSKALFNMIRHEFFTVIPHNIAVTFVAGQPYANRKELVEDIEGHKLLLVSTDHNNPTPGLMSENMNLAFRAVHDWHHYITGGGFNLKGEFKTYKHFARMAPNRRIRKILFSEIVLQAGYAIARKEFAPQKVVM